MNTPHTKAYSYIRFSDPSQAKGDSYARQHRDAVAYCKANSLDLVSDSDYTFFDEGISAYSGKLRDDDTDLSRFLSRVKDGSIAPGSYLIIESLDRLSREHVRAALPRFMDLLAAGINIHTLHGNKTYHREYDEMDLFQSILEMSRSHKESKWKSERIASKWREKQDAARLHGIPLGNSKPAWLDIVYDAAGRRVGFEPNERVAIIEKIFQYTLDGHGRNIVARMLNAEGIPAFKVATWGASSINKILTSEAVLGVYQPSMKEGTKRIPRGEPILGYYPPIIDRATFDSARAAVSGRFSSKTRKQSPRFQLWQGIGQCALCGSPLHSYSNGRKDAPTYLRCYDAKKGTCTAGSIRVDSLEPVFKEILAKLNVLALVQSSASTINAKLEAVTGQLIGERAKLKDFKATYAAKQSSTILDLIYETEAAISMLEAQEATHVADLAADQIIDKADFFARLDLESYAGRSRANSILKRLKVSVLIDPATPPRFHVLKDSTPVFDLPRVCGVSFKPVAERSFVDSKGDVLLNTYIEYAPERPANYDECKIVLDAYADRLMHQNPQDRKIVFQFAGDTIQNPARRTQYGVIMRGFPATGKSSLINLLRVAQGGRYVWSEADYAPVFKQFAEVLPSNTTVVFDDATAGKNTPEDLKLAVTRMTANVEIKGVQTIVEREVFARIWVINNRKRPFMLPADCRRFYVTEYLDHLIDLADSEAYYESFTAFWKNPDNAATIHWWFRDIDLSDFKPNSCIKTEARKQLIAMSTSGADTVIAEFLGGTEISHIDGDGITQTTTPPVREVFHQSQLTDVLLQARIKDLAPDLIRRKLTEAGYEEKRRVIGSCNKGKQIEVWQKIVPGQKRAPTLTTEQISEIAAAYNGSC
jgi:DNA invertase Pin-like site-specific DNA recombinase